MDERNKKYAIYTAVAIVLLAIVVGILIYLESIKKLLIISYDKQGKWVNKLLKSSKDFKKKNFITNIASVFNNNFTLSYTVLPCKEIIRKMQLPVVMVTDATLENGSLKIINDEIDPIKIYNELLPITGIFCESNQLILSYKINNKNENKTSELKNPTNIVIKRINNHIEVYVNNALNKSYDLNNNFKVSDKAILSILEYGTYIENIKLISN